MVFSVSRPERLPVVGAEELGEARQELDRRGEICAGEDNGGHVADARAGHHPDVLEAVRLLDEADRRLDPPPREIALDGFEKWVNSR